MSYGELMQAIQAGGALAVLVIGVFAFLKGWIVPKWVYDSKVLESDEWKNLSKDGITAIRTAVEVVERMEGRERRYKSGRQRNEDQ